MSHTQGAASPITHYFRTMGRKKKHLSRITFRLLAVLAITLTAIALQAQIVETGNITGVVRDNTGAMIAKARVTLRSKATGLTSNTARDAQGLYVSPPLAPGNYSVEIEAPGFNKTVVRVRLEVGQRAAANVVLVVGKTTETVDVESSGAVLETESSTVSNLRTEEEVKDLPLNGRNFAELLGLGAGVVPGQSQLAGSIPYAQQRPDLVRRQRPSYDGEPVSFGWHWRQRKP